MGIAMDDFSFPQVADDQSVKLTITPSLWRISSLVFPEYNSYCKEEDDDMSMSMRYVKLRSSGSVAEEKMDTLWADLNDYDFHSDRLVISQSVMQSSRTNKQESLKKSKINTAITKVTKKLFSFGTMAGAKK